MLLASLGQSYVHFWIRSISFSQVFLLATGNGTTTTYRPTFQAKTLADSGAIAMSTAYKRLTFDPAEGLCQFSYPDNLDDRNGGDLLDEEWIFGGVAGIEEASAATSWTNATYPGSGIDLLDTSGSTDLDGYLVTINVYNWPW